MSAVPLNAPLQIERWRRWVGNPALAVLAICVVADLALVLLAVWLAMLSILH